DAMRALHANRKPTDPIVGDEATQVKAAIADVVRLQKENGVDVPNDGEYTKGILIGWMTYAQGRLKGLETKTLPEGDTSGSASIFAREMQYFGDYFKNAFAGFGNTGNIGQFARTAVFCTGP